MFRSAIARRAMPAVRRMYSTTPSAAESGYLRERAAVREHAAQTSALWKKICIFGVAPSIVAAGANAYYLWQEHWEHWSHMPPLEERVEYPYQNIRTKNFPWGNGDETMFWNPEVNYHNKDKTT